MSDFSKLRKHYYYQVQLHPKYCNIEQMRYEFTFDGQDKAIEPPIFEFCSGWDPITYKEFLERMCGTEFLTVEGIFKG